VINPVFTRIVLTLKAINQQQPFFFSTDFVFVLLSFLPFELLEGAGFALPSFEGSFARGEAAGFPFLSAAGCSAGLAFLKAPESATVAGLVYSGLETLLFSTTEPISF